MSTTDDTPDAIGNSASMPKDCFYCVPTENQDFVDPTNILASIKTTLDRTSTLDECKIVALSGLESTLKTQLMLRYCYLHRAAYRYIFWLEIDSWDIAMGSFRQLAINLGFDEESLGGKESEEKVVDRVYSWLEKTTGWLLLFSNADGDEMNSKVFEHLPRTGGDIILTTRLSSSLRRATVIYVDKMQDEEAISLLLDVDSIDKESEVFPFARDIVAELECLPLAIDLARVYINNTSTSFAEYLEMLKKKKRSSSIKFNDDNNIDLYKHTVATVWQLTMDYIQAMNPMAVQILEVCTFLNPKNIPIRLFNRQYSVLELILVASGKAIDQRDEVKLKEAIESAIAILVKFSLVMITHRETRKDNTDLAKNLLAMHPFIQKVIYDTMDNNKRLYWANNIVSALNCETNDNFDSYDRRTQMIMNMYLSHIRHFITLREIPLTSTDLASLLNRVVRYLMDHGIYYDAEELAQRSIQVSREAYGSNDPNTAISVNNLASLYESQGKYDEAEPLIKHALEIQEKVLEPKYSDTVTSVNNLAVIYISQGKYDEAEPLYKRALAICEEVLEPMHPDTATSINNLAGIYYKRGKYGEAEVLYKRALTIRQEVLGLKHPSTATSVKNLADVYDKQGRYDEAEPLYKNSLAIYEEVLGPMHPSTATSMNNLAALYEHQSKYDEAERLYKRALEIREEVLGSMHPSMVTSVNNLADLYKKQGKYGEAKPLYNRALAISGGALGLMHLDTATSAKNQEGVYDRGEKAEQPSLPIDEDIMSPVTSVCNQEACNERPSNEAKPFYKRLCPFSQHWGSKRRRLAITKRAESTRRSDFTDGRGIGPFKRGRFALALKRIYCCTNPSLEDLD